MDEHNHPRMMEELRNIKKAMVQRGFQSLLLQGKKSAVGQKEVDMKRRA